MRDVVHQFLMLCSRFLMLCSRLAGLFRNHFDVFTNDLGLSLSLIVSQSHSGISTATKTLASTK